MKASKLIGGALVGLTSALLSGVAGAADFPDFDVTPGAFGGGFYSEFTADKITGNYVEVITFTGPGTFDVSLKFEAGQFVADNGVNPVPGTTSGLGSLFGYGLYGLFTGTGTFSTTAGVTTFSLSSGSLEVWVDADQDTTFATIPGSGSTPWSPGGTTSDDVLVAEGSALFGQGTLDPSLPTCDPGINCGSFGQTTTFDLTDPAGTGFFTSPVPFYNVSFQSGQLNNFELSGTQTINGSMDVVFGQVPEPGSLALVGLSLVGLAGAGATRRRAKA